MIDTTAWHENDVDRCAVRRAKRPRVLIAEDSPTQAREMRFLLEDEGFAVDEARDGSAALTKIREQIPDIVVTDLIMQPMNGLALVEAVRHEFPYIPIVLVTAFGNERVAASALRAGAASYVPKRDLGLDLVPILRSTFDVSLGLMDRRQALGCMRSMDARFTLSRKPGLVCPVVRHLENLLCSIRFCDATEVIRVGVALYEALADAIERSDDDVNLGVSLSGTTATYTIEGNHLESSTAVLSEPAEPSLLAGGQDRRRCLIRTFMDEVRQEASNGALTLIKRRHLPAGQG